MTPLINIINKKTRLFRMFSSIISRDTHLWTGAVYSHAQDHDCYSGIYPVNSLHSDLDSFVVAKQ